MVPFFQRTWFPNLAAKPQSALMANKNQPNALSKFSQRTILKTEWQTNCEQFEPHQDDAINRTESSSQIAINSIQQRQNGAFWQKSVPHRSTCIENTLKSIVPPLFHPLQASGHVRLQLERLLRNDQPKPFNQFSDSHRKTR